MSSTALYTAFIEVGASEDSATRAVEDVIHVSQLEQLATKSDIARLEVNMAAMESRLIKWMVSSLFIFVGIIASIIIALG